MVLGAFGPWATALGMSVGGVDGSNDGWVVLVAAGLALFILFRYWRAPSIAKLGWCCVAGAVAAVTTIYDRHHVDVAISQGGDLARALVHVGWGLNLAMVASISLVLAAIVTGAVTDRSSAATANVATKWHRQCPHCKEEMRRDASVCPHCRSQSTPWTLHERRWWLYQDEHWYQWDDGRAQFDLVENGPDEGQTVTSDVDSVLKRLRDY